MVTFRKESLILLKVQFALFLFTVFFELSISETPLKIVVVPGKHTFTTWPIRRASMKTGAISTFLHFQTLMTPLNLLILTYTVDLDVNRHTVPMI